MSFPFVFPIDFDERPDSMYVIFRDDLPEVKKGSILVDTRIEERSTASFTIKSPVIAKVGFTYPFPIVFDNWLYPQRGEPVEIFDTEEARVFSGFISSSDGFRIAPTGGFYTDIQCMDNHYLADKRRVAESYTSKTCGFIVTDIYNKYLAVEGVGIGSIEAGPTLIEAVFNYVRTSDAYDALAEKAGKIWYIDEDKNLYFVDRDVTPALWSATGADMIKGSSRLSGGNPMYRNRQYIRGGRDITGLQTETFSGDNVTLAFTVGYPINSTPVVTVDGGNQAVGIKGIDDAVTPPVKDCYWSKGDAVIVFDTASKPGVGVDNIVIKYYGQYDILVLATDEGEIATQKAIEGTTGFVDDIADEPKLDDKEAAFDSGEAKLAKYGVDAIRFHYDTLGTGLRAGQTQVITYSAFGLDAEEMLIESVRFRGMGTELLHQVTAIQGPEMGSWAQYFKRLASQKEEVFDKLNVGSVQVLIILVKRAETWDWEEAITTAPYACPVVALDLWPTLTLYPC